MRYGESIKQCMKLLKAGVLPQTKHDYSLRPWQRNLWNVSLWIWRILLLAGMIYLLFNLIY
jgi:hypothetical protein